MTQLALFEARNVAAAVEVPPAPTTLVPHEWPFPGMTPDDSARASLTSSEAYQNMLVAVIKSMGGVRVTEGQVLAAIPEDWRKLCGKYADATLWNWIAEKHGIEIDYVSHEGSGGFHFEYKLKGGAQ